jgi:hypothetical protein
MKLALKPFGRGKAVPMSEDTTELVLEDSMSAYKNFREVLKNLPNLARLELQGVEPNDTLDFLKGLYHLKSLSIRAMPTLKDCSDILDCRVLEELYLRQSVRFDYRILPRLRLRLTSLIAFVFIGFKKPGKQ